MSSEDQSSRLKEKSYACEIQLTMLLEVDALLKVLERLTPPFSHALPILTQLTGRCRNSAVWQRWKPPCALTASARPKTSDLVTPCSATPARPRPRRCLPVCCCPTCLCLLCLVVFTVCAKKKTSFNNLKVLTHWERTCQANRKSHKLHSPSEF